MDTDRWEDRTATLVVLAVSGLLLLATTLLWFHLREKNEQLLRLTERQTQLSFEAADDFEHHLLQLHDGLRHLSETGETLLAQPQQTTKQLATLFHGAPSGLVLALYLVDHDGNIRAEYPGGGLARLSFPVHLLSNSPESLPLPRVIRLAGDNILLIPQPLPAATDTSAELAALISLNRLTELCLPSGLKHTTSFLLDEEGRFLYHKNKPHIVGRPFTETVSPQRHPLLYALLQAMLRGERGSGTFPEQLKAAAETPPQQDLLTYSPVNILGKQWSLAFVQPTDANDGSGAAVTLFLTLIAIAGGLAALPLLALHRLASRNRELSLEAARGAAEKSTLESRLETAERHSRQLLDYAGDAIFFIDPEDGSLLELNRRAEELLGFSAQEIHTLSLATLFPGHQRRRYLRLLRNVLDAGYGEADNLLFRRKDGGLFTGAVHARLGELGSRRVVHGVLRDVTEIRRIEQELRQKNQDLLLLNEIAQHVSGNHNLTEMLQGVLSRLAQAFAGAGGGIYLCTEDSDELQLVVHQGVEASLLAELERGSAGNGIVGRVAASGQIRTSTDLQKDRRLHVQAVRAAGWKSLQAVPLTANRRITGVLFLFSRDKQIARREELNLLLAIGRQIGTAVQGAQLFEALQWQNRLTRASNRELKQSRRQLEENLARLEESNRALERLDRMKSNFLAMASHELRTPLTYVLSGTQLLQNSLSDALAADQKQVLEAIHEGGRRLEEIVQDLLEAARIESQSIYLAREPVDLPELMTDVDAEFRPLCEQRGLSLRVGGSVAVPELCGDAHYLRKTLQRLLENAVKFTPEGGTIEISAAVRNRSELRPLEPKLRPFSATFFSNVSADRLLQITVRDSGVGIDPEEQLRVFDKFYEVGRIAEHFSSRTRFGGKGVGLGLTLVKGMVEAHGGMIWVESAGTGEGARGSAFHILLPLAAEAAEEVVDAAG